MIKFRWATIRAARTYFAVVAIKTKQIRARVRRIGMKTAMSVLLGCAAVAVGEKYEKNGKNNLGASYNDARRTSNLAQR